MSKISTILTRNGSDKCAFRHTYHYLYNDLFAKFDRSASLDILESGIEHGSSLYAWKEYFPNARVTGIDIVDVRSEEFKGDDVEFVKTDIKAYVPDRKFDIIIEDGNHSNFDAMWAGEHLPKHLKEGGILVIEDVQEGFAVPFMLWGKLSGKYAVSAIDLRRYTNTHDNFLIKIEAWRA